MFALFGRGPLAIDFPKPETYRRRSFNMKSSYFDLFPSDYGASDGVSFGGDLCGEHLRLGEPTLGWYISYIHAISYASNDDTYATMLAWTSSILSLVASMDASRVWILDTMACL